MRNSNNSPSSGKGRWYGSDKNLDMYFEGVSRIPISTVEEEKVWALKFRDTGDDRYTKRLVEANLRFVVKVALEYKYYGFPVLDLIQEGNVGMSKAAKTFDPDRGFRFISYSVWWIRALIQEYILKNWSLVKLGTTQEQRAMFSALQSGLKKTELQKMILDMPPGQQVKVGNYVVTLADVRDFNGRLTGEVSTDAVAGNHPSGDVKVLDLISSTEETAEDLLTDEQETGIYRQVVKNALSLLPKREKYIVTARHLSPNKKTLRELGEEMGISKERIRQLETRALVTFRNYVSRHHSGLVKGLSGQVHFADVVSTEPDELEDGLQLLPPIELKARSYLMQKGGGPVDDTKTSSIDPPPVERLVIPDEIESAPAIEEGNSVDVVEQTSPEQNGEPTPILTETTEEQESAELDQDDALVLSDSIEEVSTETSPTPIIDEVEAEELPISEELETHEDEYIEPVDLGEEEVSINRIPITAHTSEDLVSDLADQALRALSNTLLTQSDYLDSDASTALGLALDLLVG